MLKGLRLSILIAFGILLPLTSAAQFYYGLQQTFGKNRVQYNTFDWTYFRYEQFDVYFYKGGRPVAEKASVMTRRNLDKMQRFLDHALDQRIHIMVFNSLTDLKQSNLNANDDESYNTGGVTRTAGTRMFVYFDGDYTHLEQQIRQGLAYLTVSDMLYGGFTSSLKNSTLLNLPTWYTEGLINYLSTPWNPNIDAHVMDGISTGAYNRLNSLMGTDATYCGHSIWNYIAYTYGDGVIKNLLFMTIVNRSVDRALQQVLGTSLTEFTASWQAFYTARYQNAIAAESIEGQPVIRSKKEEVLFQPRVSENGRYLAYAGNDQGFYKVYVYDYVKKKKRVVLKRGFRIAQNNDYSYPLLAWNPNNRALAAITEEKGFIWLYFYDVEKRKTERKALFGFQKILSFTYAPDGNSLLLSAVKNGQSDIFIYTIRSTSIEQITNDEFTDLYPAFYNGDKQIVFSSNRTDDSLRDKQRAWRFSANHDLFIYNRTKKEKDVLWRLTNTPDENETQPTTYQPGYLSFLSTTNGIQSRHFIAIDSSIAYVDTVTHYAYSFTRYGAPAFSRNILEEDVSNAGERIASLYIKEGRYYIYDADITPVQNLRLRSANGEAFGNNAIRGNRNKLLLDVDESEDQRIQEVTVNEVDINDYRFDERLIGDYGPQRPAQKPNAPNTAIANTPLEEKEDAYIFPPARNYFVTLFRDNFTVKMDFIFDNPQYQPFTGVPDNNLLNAGFNVQYKVGAIELFNDYRLVGGFRTDFQPVPGLSLSPNSEFLIGLIDHKKRLNKALTLSRRSQLTSLEDFFLYRVITYENHFKLSWPLNEAQRIQGSVGWRHQRGIVLSDGSVSLPLPDDVADYAVLKAAFVHDNSRMLGLNLYKGTRFKGFTEYYRSLSTANSGMHTLGLDFRHYVPIHRTFIFAARLAAGTSFGQENLIHYLGGVDNAINPRLNTETPISQTENYTFQTVVTNMRGFRQNVRNGTSFTVLNGELRLPLFSYLLNQPIRNDFIANFQVVGFGDLGTAWNGPSPWSDENAFNNRTTTTGNLTVIINRQTNPIIGGYGFGLRSRLLGYFVRADWAWGVENGIILKPIFYLSLSTDF